MVNQYIATLVSQCGAAVRDADFKQRDYLPFVRGYIIYDLLHKASVAALLADSWALSSPHGPPTASNTTAKALAARLSRPEQLEIHC